MSSTFTEFLREQAAKQAAETRTGKAVVDDWRAAVDRLFGQIRQWLAESDPDEIIQIEQKDHEVREEGLGRYRIARLDLRAFGKWVGIIPKARFTIGAAYPPQRLASAQATGRVDITDEIRRYVLYRFSRDGTDDFWLIDDLRPNSEARPFDQPAFESALASYLQ